MACCLAGNNPLAEPNTTKYVMQFVYSHESWLAGETTRVLWTLRHLDVIKTRNVPLTCRVTNVEIVALFGFVTLCCLRSLDGLFVLPFSFSKPLVYVQYIPRNMHTVFALLCFVVVKHWLIFPYPSGLLHWHCGNLTIALVPAKQPWLIWINTSCEFIMNDWVTTTKQSTTKPCAYFWDIL